MNTVLPETAARKPGRPRDARANRAILEATLELASEQGLGLSMDAVAAHAGVSKATIYRRWESKEALVLDAWRELVGPMPVPDTGSLRGDLRAIFTQLCHHAGRDADGARPAPDDRRLTDEPGDASVVRRVRRRPAPPERAVLERAVATGELPADADFDLLGDLLAGPFFYRILMTDSAVDDQLVDDVLGIVLAGARHHEKVTPA